MKSMLLKSKRTPPSHQLLRSILVAILCCAGAIAQGGPAATDKDSRIDLLLNRINELEAAQKQMQQKLDKLTGGAAPAAVVVPVVQAEAAPVEAVQASSPEPDVADGIHTLGPVQFRGFSNLDFGRSWFEKQPSGGLNGQPRSFSIGDFDLFTNTRISGRWSMLGELLITSDFSNTTSAEIDRLMLTYNHNDYLKVSFGKFATALGYYTNAFHRAQYFQTGVGRPVMFADEDNGGILPTHSIGVTATGKIPSGSLGLHWVAEVSNGRSATDPEAPIQNFVDENNGKAVNFALYARPDWAHGLQTGFSTYRDILHPAGMDAINQTILTSHLVYVGSKLEWLNEMSLVRHAIAGRNEVFNSTTSYSQLGWAFGKTRPYVRFDYQNVPAGDPILGSLGRQSGPSFGVTRRVSDFVMLKLQYGRFSRRDFSTATGLTAQLAFAF